MNKNGQALVEYVLIIALISVITVSVVSYFGGYLKDSMTKTSCSLVDQVYVEGEKPGEAVCMDKEEYEAMQKQQKGE
ncbi:TPA: Flp family type IVb pilin [Candidatus Ventrenecus stercoripullorum]|nr:Flp family type IVb pilin [Candidatus Ventrenecus stercoripullorum]